MPRSDPTPLLKRYSEDETGCWMWAGCVDPNGYGRMYHPVLKRSYLAHRYFFEEHTGSSSTTLDHLCRKPGCVNPEHLDPTTRQDNVRRGLRAKLDWDKVDFIRSCRLSNIELARRFGVANSTICNIRAGRAWREDTR